MSTRPNPVTHPRGRLPARVYWIRRGLVAAIAVVLVVGFAALLGGFGGSGGSGGAGRAGARLAADAHGTPHPSVAPTLRGAGAPSASGSAGASSTTLAQPTGPCKAADLSVQPVVGTAYAVHKVTIKLELSGSSPACTFTVSPRTVAVKVVSGQDRVWSSQDCPAAVPHDTVVVRSGADTAVPVVWGGRRSDGTCSSANAWARPGYYHALAAVIGSTPADTQFRLTVAPRAVITKTAKPKPHHAASAGTSGSGTSGTSGKNGSSRGSGSTGKGSACGGDNAAGTC